MSIYKLHATGSASASSIASIDIQVDGKIRGVLITLVPFGLDALNDSIEGEVSFQSSSTFRTNDSRGSIGMHSVSNNFLTSGGGCGSNSLSIGNLNEPVAAGERIHLHSNVGGGGQGFITVYLYVDDGVDQKPKRRLR